MLSSIISSTVTAALMIVTLWDYEGADHWFLIPTFLYGAITGKDVVDWVRGRLDTFDPLAIFALLAFIRGFMSSIVSLSTNQWLRYVEPPPDWRPWVGGMAIITTSGYLLIKLTAFIVERRPRRKSRQYWNLLSPQFSLVLWMCVAVSLLANVAKLAATGVLTNPMLLFTRTEFSGLGHLLSFSEPLPLLLTIAAIVRWRKRQISPHLITIAVLMTLLFLLTMFTSGFRGSRGDVLWTLFLAVGMIHYTVRPIPRKSILVGAILAVPFIYVYSFYKHHGVEGLRKALVSAEERQELAFTGSGEGRWYSRIVGGGTSTYSLYRILRPESDYKYALGETYVAGLSRLIPSFVWSDRPPGIIKTGTDLLYGAGSWPGRETSLVWGLSAEAMLNFGPIAAVLVNVFLGALIGMHRARVKQYDLRDARRLLLPIFFYLILVIHGSSSQLLPFQIIKNGFLVTACVVVGSKTMPRAFAGQRITCTA